MKEKRKTVFCCLFCVLMIQQPFVFRPLALISIFLDQDRHTGGNDVIDKGKKGRGPISNSPLHTLTKQTAPTNQLKIINFQLIKHLHNHSP